MKDISCNIIEDLVPLYIDDICSDETKKMIKEHLKDCSECQQKLEQMKSNLPLDNMGENFDDSKMLSKLSDKWIKSTKLDTKGGIAIVSFYVFAIIALFVMELMRHQSRLTFDFRYSIAYFALRVVVGIFIGGLMAFLGSRIKRSKKTIIFEFLIIGIPSILMLSSPFLGYIVFNISGKIGRFILY